MNYQCCKYCAREIKDKGEFLLYHIEICHGKRVKKLWKLRDKGKFDELDKELLKHYLK